MEVVALKVSDIDSKRMMLRVEQGKGRKERREPRIAPPPAGGAQDPGPQAANLSTTPVPPVSGAITLSLAASKRASGAENVVNSTRESGFARANPTARCRATTRRLRAVKDAGIRPIAPTDNRVPVAVTPRQRSAECGAVRRSEYRGRATGRAGVGSVPAA
jgi:integrase